MQTFADEMKKAKKERGHFVGFELDKKLYDEFVSFSNQFGYGSKRKIFETALKEFLINQKK